MVRARIRGRAWFVRPCWALYACLALLHAPPARLCCWFGTLDFRTVVAGGPICRARLLRLAQRKLLQCQSRESNMPRGTPRAPHTAACWACGQHGDGASTGRLWRLKTARARARARLSAGPHASGRPGHQALRQDRVPQKGIPIMHASLINSLHPFPTPPYSHSFPATLSGFRKSLILARHGGPSLADPFPAGSSLPYLHPHLLSSLEALVRVATIALLF